MVPGAAAFLFLGTLASTGVAALVGMAATELAMALQDVVIDGMVVERSRREAPEVAGTLQSLCWGSRVGSRPPL